MNIEDLLILGDDQIDYTALDATTLLRLATQEEEPYVATSALGELGSRRDPAVLVACTSVLEREMWDQHLYAFALTTLFEFEHSKAFERMEHLLDTTNETMVINGMAECVASDLDYFDHGPQRAFANALAAPLLRDRHGVGQLRSGQGGGARAATAPRVER
jgi:hypothetical protein